MYTLARTIPLRDLLLRQAIPFGLALVVAEAFYKFGSFTLECIGFLATWFVFDLVGAGARRALDALGQRG